MSRKEEENISYVMSFTDKIIEELDQSIGEVTHLLTLDCIKETPRVQHQLFDVGRFLCVKRADLGGEPLSDIKFGKLKG